MPMIAITTSNSTSVKPRCGRMCDCPLLVMACAPWLLPPAKLASQHRYDEKQAPTRRRSDIAAKNAAPIADSNKVVGSGTEVNSILILEKSIPLFAVFTVFDVPKILAFTWNPSKSNVEVLGLESLLVKVLNTPELSLSEPVRSMPAAVFVIEYVPV